MQIIFLYNIVGFGGGVCLHFSDKALDVAQRILPPGALELFPSSWTERSVVRGAAKGR